MASVILGTDIETGQEVRIGDIERRSGLYLLGKMGMGKSALAINMALQDINNWHNLFFLDPHGDAVVDLLRRMNKHKNPLLFDPEDEEYSFGINLLACDNVESLKARTDTYTKVYNVFFKLWEDSWGPWLQLILQNVLWAFIENQGYTLVDVPMFLNPRNEDFRNHIVNNIKYNPAVVDFWRYEFNRREQNQQERDEAALTRINTLLTHPYVRHIVGQQKTTLNFKSFLSAYSQEGAFGIRSLNTIWLFRLSANLAEDIKKFIGTILLSELVHAVRNRPEDERSQFCVFIDEFHNFASTDHMAILTTEGRKFGSAATYLHVERFGQLAHNQKLLGATQAIVNKVMFQSTVNDANEFAQEFAKEPTTTEIRLEPELVVSQEPFWDMLRRGHANPQIQAYIYKYLKPTKEYLDWIREEVETSRLGRMNLMDLASLYRDEAAIARIDESMERVSSTAQGFRNVGGQLSALDSARSSLENAQSLRYQALDKIKRVMTDQQHLKEETEKVRKVNQFFTGIMYEHFQLLPEQEDLAQILYTLLYHGLKKEFLGGFIPKTYKLYLECRFGDPFIPRSIPSHLALKFRPQLIEEAYLHQCLLRYKDMQKDAEEEAKHIINKESFKYKSRMEIASGETTKKLIERDIQRFRSCFRPSELTFHYDSISTKIPVRSPRDQEWLPKDCLPHVFTQEEITEIVKLCEAELTEYIQARGTSSCLFTGIDEMFDFFNLLSKPENHIRVPSGQYVEKHVNVRPVHDMTNEMAREIVKLPRYQAYTTMIDEVGDEQIVRTHRIKTHRLPKIQSMETELQAIVNGHLLCKKRDKIEAEIQARQSRWLPGSNNPMTKGR